MHQSLKLFLAVDQSNNILTYAAHDKRCKKRQNLEALADQKDYSYFHIQTSDIRKLPEVAVMEAP